ncbi:MAG: hypothetical protein E7335_07180 [Clostridiales bacterium]|nr:hypothetical protein [Clostridiales bacterium]
MNAFERMKFAMENFMIDHPEEISEFGRRGLFGAYYIPEPHLNMDQWCDADLTSRAMDAWLFARKVTGDYETGKEVEAEQEKYFFNLINPETGLAFVRENSRPYRDGYYYHMWDQGRALKHLVNRYALLANTEKEKNRLHTMIDKMVESCLKFSKTAKEADGRISRYWEADAFFDERPIQKGEDFGPSHILNFTSGCGQLLDPMIKFYVATKEKKYLDLVLELASGFIEGYEERRCSTRPMFGPDGKFAGHFHTNISTLSGIVVTAREVYKLGNEALAREYMEIAVKAWKWIFSEGNQNRGSSLGWFPECTDDNHVCDTNEFCCTADMIEFAAALAETAEVIPGYEWLDNMWDDADRFTINELYAMQILNPEQLRKYLPDQSAENMKRFDRQVKLGLGGWGTSRNWLPEMMRYIDGNYSIFTIGCCLYSGQRGLYSYWKSMVSENAGKIRIRFAGDYQSDKLVINQLPEGGMEICLKEDAALEIRIPTTADKASLRIQAAGEDVAHAAMQRGYIAFDGKAGVGYTVSWNDLEWEITETVGCINEGHVPFAEIGKKVPMTIRYKGNKVIGFAQDMNAVIPFDKGM